MFWIISIEQGNEPQSHAFGMLWYAFCYEQENFSTFSCESTDNVKKYIIQLAWWKCISFFVIQIDIQACAPVVRTVKLTTPLLSTISWIIRPFFPITFPTKTRGTWMDSSLYSNILRALLTHSEVWKKKPYVNVISITLFQILRFM